MELRLHLIVRYYRVLQTEVYMVHLHATSTKKPSYLIGMLSCMHWTGHDEVGRRPLAYDDIWRPIHMCDKAKRRSLESISPVPELSFLPAPYKG